MADPIIKTNASVNFLFKVAPVIGDVKGILSDANVNTYTSFKDLNVLDGSSIVALTDLSTLI